VWLMGVFRASLLLEISEPFGKMLISAGVRGQARLGRQGIP
jgi:hypothetical protein